MTQLLAFQQQIYLGNTTEAWVLACIVALVAYIAIIIARRIIVGRLKAFAATTETDIDDFIVDLLNKTKIFFFPIIALYIGSFLVDFPQKVANVRDMVLMTAIILQLAFWMDEAISFWIDREMKKRSNSSDASVTSLSVVRFLGRVVIWTLVVLTLLKYYGVDITALVAGLGVSGIAIALAIQSLLGDLIGSLSIVLDKPFEIGDTIKLDDIVGTVQQVGLKTTRLKSVSGEQVIIANGDLLKGRIRNFKRMTDRRVVLPFGVAYETSHELIAKIPSIVETEIKRHDRARFERSHFTGFGDSALMFETVYWIVEPDYALFMDIQQRVNLGIMKEFQKLGIEFAYPTRRVYISDAPEKNGTKKGKKV